MANCISCSAPLSGPSTICEYCGRRNDVDLHGIHKYTVTRPDSERTCPRCEVSLHTINLHAQDKFYIERCDQCFGLFFDPGELEALLETAVSNVFEINRQRLDTINRELYIHDSNHAAYITCPVCDEFMQRKNFGAKSGVVVDRCGSHGIWLDGGELKRLLEWKKAGGKLLHQKLKQDDDKPKRAAANSHDHSEREVMGGLLGDKGRGEVSGNSILDDDIVSTLFRFIDKII